MNVLAGYSFADTPDTGAGFTAITSGDPEAARRRLGSLAALAQELKALGGRAGLDLHAAMAELRRCREGPVLIVEPADNIGGGAPGDGTAVLRAFLEFGISGAAVILNDPESVARTAPLEIGASIILRLGGKGSRLGPGPVELEAELVSRSDGRFELEDPRSHLASMLGRKVDMGPCAVVRHGGVTILLTSKKTPPFDLGQWRSQGISPERLFAIGVKAAVAHRRAYDPIAKASFTVDTPGPCSSDLKRFPYRNIKRPIYPLDPV